MKKLIAGNWKMNGSLERGRVLVSDISRGLRQMPLLQETCDFLVCPPSLYLLNIADSCVEHNVSLGAQDCSAYASGAYTGEVASEMIRDCGGSYVILGHSERRQYHAETNALVAVKARAAHQAGLTAIVCVGETEDEREAGLEESVIAHQLIESLPEGASSRNLVVAYEPVWAIGTGKTASVDDVASMHGFIRTKLQEYITDSQDIRILYGGSMKPDNAQALLATPNVDGGLIGGASLDAEQFLAIGLAASGN